jgi:opacity protein-like surface antigen
MRPVFRLVSRALLAAAAIALPATVFAQQAASEQPLPKAIALADPAGEPSSVELRRGREYVGISVGAQSINYSADNTKNILLYGLTLHGGGFLSKDRPFLKNLLLSADIGIFIGDSTDKASYTSDYDDPNTGNLWNLQQTDFLKRKTEQTSVPVLLTLAYNFDVADWLDIRLGPTLGATFVSMKSDFSGRVEVDGQVTHSDSIEKSASDLIFTYALTLGITLNVTRNFSIDIFARAGGNTALDFGESRNYGDSVFYGANIGVAWRF